jgi:mRNA interferase HigB
LFPGREQWALKLLSVATRLGVRVVGTKVLFDFIVVHPDAQEPIKAWLSEAEEAQWVNPHEVKEKYGSASLLGNHIVVFNIKGNNYRLETQVFYPQQTVIIKRIGTHTEYDEWSKRRR